MGDGKATRQLHLLRHADAGDPGAWRGDDAARPLSEKGVRQAERLGRHLARAGFAPDAIVSSPRVRALETAEIVGRALAVEVRTDERLGGGVGLETVGAVLEAAGGLRRVVLVGHDPDFSELCGALTGSGYLPLGKGAIARIDAAVPLQEAGGVLRWLLPPELLADRS